MKRLLIIIIALPFIAWGLLWVWPGETPEQGYGQASRRVVLDGHGAELASAEHRGQVAGPWLAGDEITPLLTAACLAAEDHWFHNHPGVNPLALVRALGQNLAAGRVVSGGSTITMQLARLLHPAPRGLTAKLREAAHALWLERRLTKREILTQYLNRAPFGGPLVGVGAASRVLLSKHHARLSPAEAALLLALPKDPSRLLKQSNRKRLTERRNYILQKMAEAGDLEPQALARALAQPIELRRAPRAPLAAPHFVRAVLGRTKPRGSRQVATYLDPDLQQALASLAKDLRIRRGDQGIRQAAILVLRNSDRAVLAWVGSADFLDPVSGQVDGVRALRQPGSALKPFIYAMALEQGRTLASYIEDSPMALAVAGGSYRPSDYDGVFRGTVTLRIALASSLNLPALRLTAELTPPVVLEGLRGLGFTLPRSAAHYGVGLALGGGEVSLLQMAQAYAALADGGRFLPARLHRDQPLATVRHALDPYACRLVADALSDDQARALGFGRHGPLELSFPAAVKTGTSQHHRDNWCVGFTSDYTVAVWVGNFEGDPMARVSGVSGAAPLWRQVMLLLHRHAPGKLPPWPPGVTWAKAPLPGNKLAWRMEAFAPGTSPEPEGDDAPQAPPELELSLHSPLNGSIYSLDPDLNPKLQVLHCRASANAPVKDLQWTLNGRRLASGPNPMLLRLPLTPGRHVLRISGQGENDEKAWAQSRFTVFGVPRTRRRAAAPLLGPGD